MAKRPADPYERIKEELNGLRPVADTIEVPVGELGEPRTSWVPTVLGVPYVDTKRQWRDGVYHIHLTRSGNYRVHRDRYDPKVQPVRHLLFDASKTLGAITFGVGVGIGFLGRALLRRR